MPRTPLLTQIVRLAKDYRLAKARNVSLSTVADWRAEAAERKRSDCLTRRRFLAGATTIAAGLAFGRRAWAGSKSNPRIAIVGGGIAGLSCALELADHGISATVYEANTRVGGRMHSNVNYFDQRQISEWCGELIDTGHEYIQSLAERFHLPLTDLHAAEPDGSGDTYFFSGQYYPQAVANVDFEPVYDALQEDNNAAGYPTTFDTQNAAGVALDNLSVYDWIESRVPGGHHSPLGQLLDVAYTEEYGSATQVQSSLNLVYLLGFQADDYPSETNQFDIFGVSDERFHIVGGNQRLPQAIAAHLGLGARVKLGFRLESIRQTADGRFNLNFGKARDVLADYVVLCLPFPVLRKLDYTQAGFDALKVKAIQTLGASKNGKLQLQFTQRLWNGTGRWPGKSNGNSYTDVGYQNTWDVTRGQAGKSGILVDYTGGPITEAMQTKAPYAFLGAPGVLSDATRFLRSVSRVFPGVAKVWNGRCASSLPHLDPFLLLSYAHWEVGQYQTIAGYEGVRQGNCLFAGEHTSVDFQGFMEGGATTGQAAAATILADLG